MQCGVRRRAVDADLFSDRDHDNTFTQKKSPIYIFIIYIGETRIIDYISHTSADLGGFFLGRARDEEEE